MRIRLPKQLGPISNRPAQIAGMNIIKRPTLTKRPRQLGVIHKELEIGRHPARLDGTEIRAHDLGAGERVREIERPDSRSRADVQDSLDVGGDRGAEEFPLQCQIADVVQ